MFILTPSSSKSLFSKCSSFTRKRKAGVFKFIGLKSVFEKLCSCDRLGRTAGLTVEIKFSGVVGTGSQR